MGNLNLLLVAIGLVSSVLHVINAGSCRFALNYTVHDMLTSEYARQSFVAQYLAGEAEFIQLAGLDHQLGMTFDGRQLDIHTGLLFEEGHRFSAASKESLHWAILLKILEKDPRAAPFGTIDAAFEVLDTKMSTYEQFNREFPGFGGYLPWVAYDEASDHMTPSWDFQNRVPALDNGELFWAAYAVAYRLEKSFPDAPFNLAVRVRAWMDLMIKYATVVFYDGNGHIRAVTRIGNQSVVPEKNTYSNDGCVANCYLDDPYEGELFTNIIYLFSSISDAEKKQIWINKRAKLQRVEFAVPGSSSSITVQRGWWMSSHEQWKYLFMPYLSSPIHKRLFMNAERARSWNSNAQKIPGLYASVNAPIYSNDEHMNYFSDCGIQPIAFEMVSHHDVVTPYGAYPMLLIAPEFGLSWLLNMIQGPRGQSIVGTIEALNITGTGVAPIATWDSKITNVVALLGGTWETNSLALKDLGLLDDFLDVVTSEWETVFPDPLLGEDLPLATPSAQIPYNSEISFSTCQ
eukprot:ANDGO_08111.mRNA.1 hypothetical protein CAOG_08566